MIGVRLLFFFLQGLTKNGAHTEPEKKQLVTSQHFIHT